ncbi:MAG: hypothetical protein OEL66_06270, partial [Desulfobulbaceae bacterium]|nr:hypothetical protein [Desulfobulbaceae bacterium]
HASISKFNGRFSEMERLLADSSQQFTDLDYNALLDLWRKSKHVDQGGRAATSPHPSDED